MPIEVAISYSNPDKSIVRQGRPRTLAAVDYLSPSNGVSEGAARILMMYCAEDDDYLEVVDSPAPPYEDMQREREIDEELTLDDQMRDYFEVQSRIAGQLRLLNGYDVLCEYLLDADQEDGTPLQEIVVIAKHIAPAE